MNPYLAFALVMCLVIFLALAATAYMAVYFTRRAKADLTAALAPLAEAIDGEANTDDAEVTGRYHGKLAFGRMSHAEGGPVRVFQVDLIDAAGGEEWMYVAYPEKGTIEIRPEGSPVVAALSTLQQPDLASTLGITSDWLQLQYSPEGGYLRLTVPMATRKDIPPRDRFERQLAVLDTLSDENRAIQEERTGDQ